METNAVINAYEVFGLVAARRMVDGAFKDQRITEARYFELSGMIADMANAALPSFAA